jgi:hypothetical protein
VQVQVEQLDVADADAQAWWAQQWAHGERRPLEQMDPRTLAAYRAAARKSRPLGCRGTDPLVVGRHEAVGSDLSLPRAGGPCQRGGPRLRGASWPSKHLVVPEMHNAGHVSVSGARPPCHRLR